MKRTTSTGFAIGIFLLLASLLGIRWLSAGGATEAAPIGAPVTMDPSTAGLHVTLGIGDTKATPWEGELVLSKGRIARLDPWRPERNWEIEGNRFRVRTRRIQRGRYAGEVIVPQLFLTVLAPDDAVIQLKTNHGDAQFRLEDVTSSESLTLLEGRASVRRTTAATRITGAESDDDYPAATVAPDGSLWLAYVSYQHGTPLDLEAIARHEFDSMITENNGDRIFLRRYNALTWSAPVEVTQGLADAWRPTVSVDGEGNVWVAWSQNVDGNWDVYRRRFDPRARTWSERERMTDAPGTDMNVVSARDRDGNVWWAWQGWRGDNFDILLLNSQDDAEKIVANTSANEWNPALAADASGNVYVGWDSYETGSYNVLVRRFGRQPGEAISVAASDLYEARVSLACDASDRLWIAYEEDDANWGKDYATLTPERVPLENLGIPLYLNRRVRVKCLQRSELHVTADGLQRALEGESPRPKSLPRIAAGPGGQVWLFYRHHVLRSGQGELWGSYATVFDGTSWSAPQFVPSTDYVLDSRPALAPVGGLGLVAVFTSDGRARGGGPNLAATRYHPVEGDRDNDLFATVLTTGEATGDPRLLRDVPLQTSVPPVHPNEAEAVARMRKYRLEASGKTYQLLRGEFHRHTEFTAHRDQDGGLEEVWRYGLDAATMEWIGVGDHDNGWGREYPWWIMQKMASLFHHPPHFVTPFTYERSNVYPNGHRNVMFAERGIRTLTRGELLGTPEQGTPDTKDLYAYLHHFGGICAIHTSGTRMGTDWRDNDPVVEPVVEIYQGHRHNYESFGAPRSPTEPTNLGGYQPAGFVWNALAKGYRLGFQSSSDHVSTHISYAVLLAEEVSREGLLDAFRKRHSYGATDNILLDVRAGEYLMGDEFRLPRRQPVRLSVKVIGTRRLARVHVIKNNGHVYTTSPAGRETEFIWEESPQPAGTTSYYYVRVEQEDGQLAWSSPIWVSYE